jgi:hypothetical protein
MIAVLLVVAAILVAVVQQIEGVRLVGPWKADDGAFAVQALHGFRDAIAQGDLLPHWIDIGNGGLGSPIFFYYPPGAYAVATLLARVWPSLSDAGAIGLGCTVFRVVALLSCAAWLRRRTDTPTALFGGALYALMPYVAFVNPQMRLAFAETAAGAILPLAFLAVDLGAGRIAKTMCLLAPVMACLVLTHLPMTVIAGGLVIAYGAFSATSWRDAARGIVAAVAGTALGLALASITTVPTLLLQSASQLEAAFNAPNLRPENRFMFSANLMHSDWPLMDAFKHSVVLLPALAASLGWYATRRTATAGQRGVLLTLALAFFLLTPASRLLWAYLPFLRKVQFPFRFSLPISLFGAVALALALPVMSRRGRYGIALCGVGLAAVLAVAAWHQGDHRRSDAVRTAEGLASAVAIAREYIPAAARVRDWETPRARGAAVLHQTAEQLSGCPEHRALPVQREGRQFRVGLLGCAGPVVVPLFYFPGWSGPADLPPPVADPQTGLVLVTVPPGTDEVVLRRTVLPEETLGRTVSLAACVVWMLAGLLVPGRTPVRGIMAGAGQSGERLGPVP